MSDKKSPAIRFLTTIHNGLAQRQSQPEIVISSVGAVVGIDGSCRRFTLCRPHSQLTRPFSFADGYLISATVGVTCAQWIPDLFLTSGLAVGLAIVERQLRCPVSDN